MKTGFGIRNFQRLCACKGSRRGRQRAGKEESMRRIFLLPVALIAALLVATAAGASNQTVQITKNGFTPASVRSQSVTR